MASTSSVGTAKSPPSTPPPAAGSSSSSRNRRRTPPLSRSARNRPPSFAIGSPPSQPCFLPAVGLSVGEEKQDPFDFSAVRSALKQLEASPKSAGVKSNEEKEINSGLAVTVEVGTGSKRTRTGIQSLPDEVLVKIFAQARDHYGFHPRPRGWTWYNPPTKLALVCRRWLPIARQLIYRDVAIHHIGRIPLLHSALAARSDLAIRTLDISLLPSVATGLSQSDDAAEGDEGAGEVEADDLSLSTQQSPFNNSSHSPINTLRDVVHRISPTLRRLSITGLDPSAIFVPPSSVLSHHSPFSHLKRSQFANLVHLTISHCAAEGSPLGRVADLRGPLLALRALRSLRVQGYRSSTEETLDVASGASTKSLRPNKLKLRRLHLTDCQFSPTDLLTLFHHIAPGSLEELSVWNYHDPLSSTTEPDNDDDDDFATLPTTLHVGHVLSLVASSLRTLRVGLYNYPVVTIASASLYTSRTNGPHGPPRPLPSSISSTPQSWHIDLHLSQLEKLQNLSLGGSTCSAGVLDRLPASVKKLELASCELVDLRDVIDWVQGLRRQKEDWGVSVKPPSSNASPRRTVTASSEPLLRRRSIFSTTDSQARDAGTQWDALSSLKTLTILGSSGGGGGRDHEERWELQRACWNAGVVLQTGMDGRRW